jgi:flagellar basal-body rod modification protein FlgD
MQVNAISTQAIRQAPPSVTASDAASVDFQSFLRLLTAQLRYQDPLSPLDSTQFVAQLASFSTVEQLVSANARLDAIAGSVGGAGLEALAPWIGRTAETANSPAIFDGTPVPFRIDPIAGATNMALVIRDGSGVEVHRQAVANNIGIQFWDGTGAPAPGPYFLSVDYVGVDGKTQSVPAAVFSRVIGVRADADGGQLQLASGAFVTPQQVRGLSE